MRSEGIENLKTIFRRSRWIVLLLIAIGIAQMNFIRHHQGALYRSSSHVILSPTDLATALAGLNAYADPATIDQTEKALADSPALFAYVAKQSHEAAGSASVLESATSVDKNGTAITFTGSSSSASEAEAVANAVAHAYPSWRASISNATLTSAIDQLKKSSSPDGVAQLNKLRLLKTVTSGNVLLVEPSTGVTKVRPSPVKDSLLGLFIGLFAALVVIGLREAFDTRVRSEREVEDVLRIPVLASLERFPRRGSSLVFAGQERGRFSDMYALLAASIARTREGKDRTVIAVTSATPKEGKSTTAANLAAALAGRNAHVRLVDLDTRRPSLARLFSIPLEASGVDRALLGEVDVRTLLWDITTNGAGPAVRRARMAQQGSSVRERVSRLQVLPMGSSSINSITAHADRLSRLIDKVGEETEYVVVDTPPALAVPDTTDLIQLADIVLVVVRHGRATRRNLEALRRLQRTWPETDIYAVIVDTPPDGDTYSDYGSE